MPEMEPIGPAIAAGSHGFQNSTGIRPPFSFGNYRTIDFLWLYLRLAIAPF
jgi:hypothetical protein